MTLFKNLSGEGSLRGDNDSRPPGEVFGNSADTGRSVSAAAGGVALRAEQVLSDLVSKSSACLPVPVPPYGPLPQGRTPEPPGKRGHLRRPPHLFRGLAGPLPGGIGT